MSDKLLRLLRALYEGTQLAVRVEGELTDWFEVRSGLRQGCLLFATLFNFYIDRVIRRTISDLNLARYGIKINYRMQDGRSHLGDEFLVLGFTIG